MKAKIASYMFALVISIASSTTVFAQQATYNWVINNNATFSIGQNQIPTQSGYTSGAPYISPYSLSGSGGQATATSTTATS
jgi:hypothetical protein